MPETKLLELRRRAKARKPAFVRQDINNKKKLKNKWRRAKGLQSKIRRGLKGYSRQPSRGFGSPAAVRGLDRSGLEPGMVHNANMLSSIIKEIHGIIIGSGVGMKNKIEIVKICKEKGIKILNIKDAEAFLKDAEKSLEERKQKSRQKEAKAKKETKKQEKLDEKVESKSDDEKKEQEKLEKDKLLTKRV